MLRDERSGELELRVETREDGTIVASHVEHPSTPKPHDEKSPMRVAHVDATEPTRVSTGSPAFDHVLGGGAVLETVVVLSAEPGCGKSTLSTITLHAMARSGLATCYFSGEEPKSSLLFRCRRLGLHLDPNDVFDVRESSNLEEILLETERYDYQAIALDSFGVLSSAKYGSHKERMGALFDFAHKRKIFILAINHFTKDGLFAGDMASLHLADVCVVMQKDPETGIIRLGYDVPMKNRWGPATRFATLSMDPDTGKLLEHTTGDVTKSP